MFYVCRIGAVDCPVLQECSVFFRSGAVDCPVLQEYCVFVGVVR